MRAMGAREVVPVPTPERELLYLLALRALPGLGDIAQAALLKKFGSAKRAWLSKPRAWARVGGAAVTGAMRDAALAEAERAASVLARLGAVTTDILQPDYPRAFRDLHDPPAACFLLGDLGLLNRTMVAIVGSRAHTPHGADAVRLLAAQLAHAGLVIVSGLARGIDGLAHESAHAVGGVSVAVLGNGLDVRYPPEHAALQEEIAGRGLLVSEFLPREPPRPHNFPRRNRLIAALARGVLVVEAGRDSGSLITAEHALDLGRPVMAVPGPITSPAHEGSNRLLREGAPWVFDAEDVFQCLADHGWDGNVVPPAAAAPGSPGDEVPGRASPSGDAARDRDEPLGLAPDERRIWRSLARDPRHVDELCVLSGLDAARVLGALSNLEFRGIAKQLPGKRFALARAG